MKYNNVVIEAIDYVVPETRLTSDALEAQLAPLYDRLKLPYGRLELMTGIKARRFWPSGTFPSHIASQAGKKILDEKNDRKEQIDLLIHASVCRDFLEPASASVSHKILGLKDECMFFDLSNACLGVVNSMAVAADMIEKGSIKKALILSGENGGPLVEKTIAELLSRNDLNRKNIKSYIANLTIGSAGVAVLLSHNSLAQGPRLTGGVVYSDSASNHLCRGDGDVQGLSMHTDSEALLKAGITLTQKTWKKAQSELDWTHEQFNWVLGHQVGKAHQEQVLKGLDFHQHPTFTTYEEFGNTGSAALPLTLAKLKETNQIKNGDQLLLVGIGSGLSSIMLGVEW